MKKLLLSIVALVCCMSLNAKDTVLRDSTVTFVDDKPSTKEVYTYDENGYTTGTYRYTRVDNEWVLNFWDLRECNDQGYFLHREVYQKYNGETNGLEYTDKTYNENNKVTSTTSSRWIGGEWVLNTKTEYTYTDDNEKVKELIDSKWRNGSWEYYSKESHEYDANGVETGYTVYMWDGDWVLTKRYECENDEAGNLITLTQFNAFDSANIPLSRTVYTRDELGNYTSVTSYTWMSDSWLPIRKTDYGRDEKANVTFAATYNYIDGEWVIYNRNDFVYDERGNQIHSEGYIWINGDKMGDSYTDYIYDDQNREIGIMGYWWNDGTWEIITKMEYVFDEGNHIMESFFYSINNGEWHLNSHTVMYYTDHANGIDEVVFGAPGAVVRKYVKNGKVVIERARNSYAVDGRMMK